MAAGVEDQVVGVRVDVLQPGGAGERGPDGVEVRGDGVGPLPAAVGRSAQAALVDGGRDTAGRGDGDLVAGLAEDAVRLGELLGQ